MKALIGAIIGLFFGFIIVYINPGGHEHLTPGFGEYLFLGVPLSILGGIIGLGFEIASKKKRDQ
jgi:hypothetical protein